MVAELVIRGVGTWREIEREMTLPRLYALRRVWRRLSQPAPAAGDLAALVAMMGGAGPIR